MEIHKYNWLSITWILKKSNSIQILVEEILENYLTSPFWANKYSITINFVFYPNNLLLPLWILSYQESAVAVLITSLALYMLYICHIYIYNMCIYIYIYIYIHTHTYKQYIYIYPDFQWSIPENIQIGEGWGYGSSMVIKKNRMWKFQLKNNVIWNFHWPWFLTWNSNGCDTIF